VFGVDIEEERKWVTTRKIGLLVFDISLETAYVPYYCCGHPLAAFLSPYFYHYYYSLFFSMPNKQATKFLWHVNVFL